MTCFVSGSIKRLTAKGINSIRPPRAVEMLKMWKITPEFRKAAQMKPLNNFSALGGPMELIPVAMVKETQLEYNMFENTFF